MNYLGRRTVVAMGCIVIAMIGVRAFANNAALDNVAKDASRYGLVRKLCSSFIPLNEDAIPTVIESTLWVGTEKYGATAMRSALAHETERQTKEIRSLGLVQWCQQQRSILQNDSVGRHFLK